MQNSRDSSVWRSLAVAFGDGVAFGVGMKLTRSAERPPASQTPDEAPPDGGRLDEIERRMARIEQSRAALPQAPSGSFDRKVMEAVVNALDARLHELSGQVERRLTETEARIALELKTLNQQDHKVATQAGSLFEGFRVGCDARLAAMEARLALEGEALDQREQTLASAAVTRIEEVRASCDAQLAAFRQSVDAEFAGLRGARQEIEAAVMRVAQERAAAEMDAYADKLEPALAERIAAAVQAAVEACVAAEVASQVRPIEEQLQETIRQSAGLAAAAAETALDGRMGALHAELAEREAEIGGLRQRAAETDRNTLDVLLAIGKICQEASARMSDPAAPGPGERALAQPGLESAPEPPPETAAAAPPIEAQSERNLAAGPQPHSLVTRPLVAPTFGQIKRPGHAWGVPLVSSFLFTTGCLALMRLL